MLTREEVDQILTSISYKPGWLLEWEWRHQPVTTYVLDDVVQIRWHMKTVDAYDHDKQVFFTTGWFIPHYDYLDEEGLVRMVWHWTLKAEQHEAGEFFVYAEERPFDPHKSVLEHGVRVG